MSYLPRHGRNQAMKSIQYLFPRASADTVAANPHLSAISTPSGKQNAVQPILGVPQAKRGRMNKTEASFAMRLEAQKRNGEIRDYLFHPMSLPWAGMRYSPDFMVTPNSGLEKRRMIEVKGPHIHYRQQAVARFKGCRAYWPEFQFECWQKKKTGWEQII